MSLVGSAQRMIAQRGEVATLRRSATGAADVDVSVRAFVAHASRQPLAGTVVQMEREARISNAEIAAASWPGPPRPGDRLVVGSTTYHVQAVDTLKDAGAIAIHVLSLRG